jgi:predicted O-linked N-acetylglucosamine transferase (SPINDLY family)
LIASSFAEYEALALDLARDRPRLEAVRRHLRAQRDTAPLFDSPRFTRGLEVAYRRMWVQFAEGNAPQTFDVRED